MKNQFLNYQLKVIYISTKLFLEFILILLVMLMKKNCIKNLNIKLY
jgi:hypothetical protein